MTALTNTSSTMHHDPGTPAAVRPRALRRTAVALTGLLAGFMPVVWTVNIAHMLLTGIETDHQFHQATGQGLLLTALWLSGVAPLVRAGRSGRRPSTALAKLEVPDRQAIARARAGLGGARDAAARRKRRSARR